MRALILLALVALASSCQSDGSVRSLGKREQAAFRALSERLETNEQSLEVALGALADLSADYAAQEYALERATSKAKLLESMREPWSSDSNAALARRAVVLHHLYDLESTEAKILDARVSERRAAIAEVGVAYARLRKLSADAARNLELVLEHLDQPKSAQIRAFTASFLQEAKAFRVELETSDNPRLVALARDVVRYEEQAQRAEERIGKFLEAVLATE